MPQDMQTKLQLNKMTVLELVNAPAEQANALRAALPALQVRAFTQPEAPALMVFLNNSTELHKWLPRLPGMLAKDGIFWLAYPKTAARGGTDINRDSLWQLVEPLGWRPVRQVALDEIWSALRFKPA